MKKTELRNIIREEIQKTLKEGSIKNLQLEFSEIVSQILGKDAEIQMANVMGNTVLIVKNEQLDQSVRQDIEDEFNYQTDSGVLIRGHQIKGADTVFILK